MVTPNISSLELRIHAKGTIAPESLRASLARMSSAMVSGPGVEVHQEVCRLPSRTASISASVWSRDSGSRRTSWPVSDREGEIHMHTSL